MSSRESTATLGPISSARPQRAWYEPVLERDLLPDWLIRAGIRRICAARLREQSAGGPDGHATRKAAFVAELKRSPIAVETGMANSQHYEVPAEFFHAVLGKQLKYSCAYWPAGVQTLDAAEEAMLNLYFDRARLADGQSILDLGCGWGSLSLYLAAQFPASRVTGVSNSRTQKAWIDARARERGIGNLTILTADINLFSAPQASFDRVLSIEMFEHMRNYHLLLERVASWMKPDALLFIHIFAHRAFAYPYEAREASDWMAQHFFSGGIMPSDDLLTHFQDHVRLLEQWQLSGTHYEKTANAWLANMDGQRPAVLRLFARTYGEREALRWWVRWRVFFMSCAELWGYAGGREWLVSHYLFERRR